VRSTLVPGDRLLWMDASGEVGIAPDPWAVSVAGMPWSGGRCQGPGPCGGRDRRDRSRGRCPAVRPGNLRKVRPLACPLGAGSRPAGRRGISVRQPLLPPATVRPRHAAPQAGPERRTARLSARSRTRAATSEVSAQLRDGRAGITGVEAGETVGDPSDRCLLAQSRPKFRPILRDLVEEPGDVGDPVAEGEQQPARTVQR
jgi:hypothetical protein